MTTLVASRAIVPIALATCTEVQKPLATVAIGGLLTATQQTFVVLPALYAHFAAPATADQRSGSAQSLVHDRAAE